MSTIYDPATFNPDDLRAAIAETKGKTIKDSTRADYDYWNGCFRRFCTAHGYTALPALPETFMLFIEAKRRDGVKVSTLRIVKSAIDFMHREARLPSPTQDPDAKDFFTALGRVYGAPPKKKKPFGYEQLKLVHKKVPHKTVMGKRNWALLAFGISTGLRGDEIVSIRVDDLEFTDQGMIVTVRRSKTDVTNQGRTVTVPFGETKKYCPVIAVRAWISEAGITTGPVFCHVTNGSKPRPVAITAERYADLVKRYVEAIGLNPRDYAAHSTRRGMITDLSHTDLPLAQMQQFTGHKCPRAMLGYVETERQFRDHPQRKVFK